MLHHVTVSSIVPARKAIGSSWFWSWLGEAGDGKGEKRGKRVFLFGGKWEWGMFVNHWEIAFLQLLCMQLVYVFLLKHPFETV